MSEVSRVWISAEALTFFGKMAKFLGAVYIYTNHNTSKQDAVSTAIAMWNMANSQDSR